jgi:hypothetical protein
MPLDGSGKMIQAAIATVSLIFRIDNSMVQNQHPGDRGISYEKTCHPLLLVVCNQLRHSRAANAD